MIVLRSPKGWTGPKEVDGHKVENFWRAHQIPSKIPTKIPQDLEILDKWLRSYEPTRLFTEDGHLVPELKANWRQLANDA